MKKVPRLLHLCHRGWCPLDATELWKPNSTRRQALLLCMESLRTDPVSQEELEEDARIWKQVQRPS